MERSRHRSNSRIASCLRGNRSSSRHAPGPRANGRGGAVYKPIRDPPLIRFERLAAKIREPSAGRHCRLPLAQEERTMSEDQLPGTGSERSGITRRQFVKRGAVGAVGLASIGSIPALLAACGSSSAARAAPRRAHAAGHRSAQRRPVRPRHGRQGRGQAQHHRPAAQLGQLRQDHQHLPEQVRHHRQQRRTRTTARPRRTRRSSASRASRAHPTWSTSVRRLPPRA